MKKFLALVLVLCLCMSLGVAAFAAGGTAASSYIQGDINDDGTVNISDVQALLKYVNGQNISVVAAAIDVDDNGSVNISDAQLLLKYVNGQNVTLGSGNDSGSSVTAGFQWNGQYVVWSILQTSSSSPESLAMGAKMKAEGFTFVEKYAQSSPYTQVQLVKDAISAGNVGCLMIEPLDVDILQNVVLQAIDAGIAVVMYGAEPVSYEISGGVHTAYEIIGMFAVQAAENWVLNSGANVPNDPTGKYEVAIDCNYETVDGTYRGRAVSGTAQNSSVLTTVAELTSYDDDAFNDAYNNTADVLGYHPDCHIFIAHNSVAAMGVASALEDYCMVCGLNVADYCVISCSTEDSVLLELYGDASVDPSASPIKGYVTFGDDLSVAGEHLADVLLGVCGVGNYKWNYGEFYYETITAVDVCGFTKVWTMGNANPAAAYRY